jgi:hypothetical protein
VARRFESVIDKVKVKGNDDWLVSAAFLVAEKYLDQYTVLGSAAFNVTHMS